MSFAVCIGLVDMILFHIFFLHILESAQNLKAVSPQKHLGKECSGAILAYLKFFYKKARLAKVLKIKI